MKITADHWLEGVRRDPISGGSVMSVRRFVVWHHTAGWSAQSSVDFWKTPEAKGASAHLIIDRDGTVIQCRPFNRTCGHAGASSKWKDPNTGKTHINLNICSIGIELANAGNLKRTPDVYPKAGMGDLGGRPIPRLLARHKNGGPATGWETYTFEQLKALEIVSKALVERYNLDDALGHEDCAKSRKVDPGPAFPMEDMRKRCGFTKPLAPAMG